MHNCQKLWKIIENKLSIVNIKLFEQIVDLKYIFLLNYFEVKLKLFDTVVMKFFKK